MKEIAVVDLAQSVRQPWAGIDIAMADLCGDIEGRAVMQPLTTFSVTLACAFFRHAGRAGGVFS
jgi:hypothetical protein